MQHIEGLQENAMCADIYIYIYTYIYMYVDIRIYTVYVYVCVCVEYSTHVLGASHTMFAVQVPNS